MTSPRLTDQTIRAAFELRAQAAEPLGLPGAVLASVAATPQRSSWGARWSVSFGRAMGSAAAVGLTVLVITALLVIAVAASRSKTPTPHLGTGLLAWVQGASLQIGPSDGTGLVAWSAPGTGLSHPLWVPGRSAVLFQAPDGIHLADFAGTTLNDHLIDRGELAGVSPDGLSLVANDAPTVSIIDLASGSIRRTLALGVNTEYPTAWSPVGPLLLSDPSCEDTIDLINVDSGAITPFGIPGGGSCLASAPDWDPTGSRIAWTSWRNNQPDPQGTCPFGSTCGSLWTMRADGTDRQPLAGGSGISQSHATWSPGGEWIAFLDEETPQGPVTSARAGPTLDPSVTPAPSQAATELPRPTVVALVIVRPDGTGARVLVPAGHVVAFQWDPEGASITYLNDDSLLGRSGSYSLWHVTLDGKAPTRLLPAATAVSSFAIQAVPH